MIWACGGTGGTGLLFPILALLVVLPLEGALLAPHFQYPSTPVCSLSPHLYCPPKPLIYLATLSHVFLFTHSIALPRDSSSVLSIYRFVDSVSNRPFLRNEVLLSVPHSVLGIPWGSLGAVRTEACENRAVGTAGVGAQVRGGEHPRNRKSIWLGRPPGYATAVRSGAWS